MAEWSKVGERGAVVIPAELRQRFGFEEDVPVLIEAREDGVLLRPAGAALPPEYRAQFLAESNRAYAELRQDQAAWDEELAERRVLEGSLLDGLEVDEVDDDWIAAWVEEGRLDDTSKPR